MATTGKFERYSVRIDSSRRFIPCKKNTAVEFAGQFCGTEYTAAPVTRSMLCLSAVAAIRPSISGIGRPDLRSLPWTLPQRSAVSVSKGTVFPRKPSCSSPNHRSRPFRLAPSSSRLRNTIKLRRYTGVRCRFAQSESTFVSTR